MITFRPAVPEDIPAITEIYDHIHDAEEAGSMHIGWQRTVYPTKETAETAIRLGDMYVELDSEQENRIVAAARLNHEQVEPTYSEVSWLYSAGPAQVMVMHTLVVDPATTRNGYGTAFAEYYEEFAREHGCSCLRIDTNEKNQAARRLYKRLGYREAAIIPCVFNGIPSVNLVCLEKAL